MNKKKMITETKRIAKKYLGIDGVEVIFSPVFMHGRELKALCQRDVKRIFYNERFFKVSDESDKKEILSTIIHEVCHLKWSHGNPNFKRNVLSIFQREWLK